MCLVLTLADITSRTTFNDVEDFHDAILRVKDANSVPFMLVGNKADMEEKRVVQKSELEEKAKKLGCKFMETSAKSRQNVDEIFTYAHIFSRSRVMPLMARPNASSLQ
jgi:GTPase SAR1 family protein